MRILMVLNKPFPQDPRAQKEVLSLSGAGHQICVLCFADPVFALPDLPGVRFHSFPLVRRRSSKVRYFVEYMAYLLWCSLTLFFVFARWQFDVLQVSLLPEPLFFVCLVPKLAGVRIVTDWMDLGLELYCTKFAVRWFDPVPPLFRLCERLIVNWSDAVVVPNRGFSDVLAERGLDTSKCRVVMNAADVTAFLPDGVAVSCREVPRLIFTGTISARSGLGVLKDAFRLARQVLPELTMTVLGEPAGDGAEAFLEELVKQDGVTYLGRVPYDEIPKHVHSADVGVIPMLDTPSTRVSIPTRIFEFGAAGKPVICSDLPAVGEYFTPREVLFCKPGSAEHLAQCICDLAKDHDLRRLLADALHARCTTLSWQSSEMEYLSIIKAFEVRSL